MRKYFRCSLLAPIQLAGQAGTEMNNLTIDYLPSRLFTGLLAKNRASIKSLLNGHIYVSDGHIEIANRRSLRIPLTWYHKKYEAEKIRQYSSITAEEFQTEQWKQRRTGYFVINEHGQALTKEIKTSSSIHGAYNREAGRMKDSTLHLRNYISRGQDFIFYIDTKEENVSLNEKLVGDHSLGKKKKGIENVRITAINDIDMHDWISYQENPDSHMIYAESNLCSINPYGTYVAYPQEAQIEWCKSQVRRDQYHSYNAKRQCWNPTRSEVTKGSVFQLKSGNSLASLAILRSEGRGQMLVSPAFLYATGLELELSDDANFIAINEEKVDDEFYYWLEEVTNNRKALAQEQTKIFKIAKSLKSKLSNVTASQWSALANKCREEAFSKDFSLQQIDDYLKAGRRGIHWEGDEKQKKNSRNEPTKKDIFLNAISTSKGELKISVRGLIDLTMILRKSANK